MITKGKMGHCANKHPLPTKTDPKVSKEVKDFIKDGSLSCPDSEKIAASLGIPISDIGRNTDLKEIRLSRCQLGLFGPKVLTSVENITKNVRSQVSSSLEDGRLPCEASWVLAKQLNVSRLEIGAICEGMNIKISKCQLGAF
jgi:hypothetical protein